VASRLRIFLVSTANSSLSISAFLSRDPEPVSRKKALTDRPQPSNLSQHCRRTRADRPSIEANQYLSRARLPNSRFPRRAYRPRSKLRRMPPPELGLRSVIFQCAREASLCTPSRTNRCRPTREKTVVVERSDAGVFHMCGGFPFTLSLYRKGSSSGWRIDVIVISWNVVSSSASTHSANT